MPVIRLVILFSGEGSNLENIIKELHKKEIEGKIYEVTAAICNKKEVNGIKRAEKYGIDTIILEHKNFKNREEFDKKLIELIKSYKADIIVLAGFMRILTPVFTDNVKAINLHPSLLPLFRGANAIEESFKSDMKVAGVTVHYVSSELDAGDIILQKCFQKEEGETLKSFTKKIKELEFELLPKAIVMTTKDK